MQLIYESTLTALPGGGKEIKLVFFRPRKSPGSIVELREVLPSEYKGDVEKRCIDKLFYDLREKVKQIREEEKNK